MGHESDSLLLFILHPSHRAKFPPSILFLSPSRACNVLNEDECIPVKSHALHSGCVLRGLSGGRSDSPYRGIAQRHIMRLWWNQSLASCGWWLVVDPSVRPRKRVSAQRCTVSSPFHVAEILPIDRDRSIVPLSLSIYIYPSLSILFGAPPPRCTIAHVPWRILENFSVDILVLSMGVGDNYRLLGNHGWKFYERKKCDGDKSFVGDRILIKWERLILERE